MNPVDADLYRKALTSRNNSYGLGALAYLRRVVENKMNDLLELLRQAAEVRRCWKNSRRSTR